MENKTRSATIVEYFAELKDPRRYNRRHYLEEILVIAICAAIAGVDGSGQPGTTIIA